MGYCGWASSDPLDRVYHDTEWGIPVHDDRHMFEHLTLECMQCGLSWGLMLKKRAIFRVCFDNFEYDIIAKYDETDIERILNTEGHLRYSPQNSSCLCQRRPIADSQCCALSWFPSSPHRNGRVPFAGICRCRSQTSSPA